MNERYHFRFEGSAAGALRCDVREAHPPHVVCTYRTVRWGDLQRFCLGREGETEAGVLRIEVTKFLPGNPAWPTVTEGCWWLESGDDPEA
jgi:hypothetical protein